MQASNHVHVHGSIDPWHALGFFTNDPDEPHGEDVQSILVPGTSHCADMYPAKPEDPAELVGARKSILEAIRRWIK